MKKIVAVLNILFLCLMASAALADSSISGLNTGNVVQTQDQIPVYRPSSPGTNFRVNVGSAATVNIGTSGATLGLLNTANTYSALQTFLSGDMSAADPVFTGGSILLPIGTTGQRPGTPLNGMLRYNSTTVGIEAYVGGVWGPIAGGGSGITALTGDGTASGTGSVALTLATVNSGPAIYGDSSHVAQYTVNGKGLVTLSANVAITPAAIGAPTTSGTGASGTWGISVSGNAATVTTNANLTGAVTSVGNAASLGSFTSANLAGALTDETGTGAAVFAGSPTLTGTVSGAAATWSAVDTALNFAATGTGADTLPSGTSGQRPSPANGMLRYNSTVPQVEAYYSGAWNALGGVGNVSVTAATPDLVVTPSPGTGTFTIGSTELINAQGTAASYTILAGDMGKTITHAKATAVAVTLPQAGTTGFPTGVSYSEINLGAGTVTITPTTSTINGASTLALSQNQSAYIISDGTNWIAFLGAASGTNLTVGTTTIASGTTSRVLYDNAGALGEYSVSGTGSVCLTTSCTMVTPTLGAATATTINGVTIPSKTDTVALLGTTEVFSASQRATVSTITLSSHTATPNFDTGADFAMTLDTSSCSCTLANPSTTPVAGQHGLMYVIQPASGGPATITTWGSDYYIAGGTSAITLSTGANAIDVFSYGVKDSTHIVLSTPSLNVTH